MHVTKHMHFYSVCLVATVAKCTKIGIGKAYTFLGPYVGIICCSTKTMLCMVIVPSRYQVLVKSIRNPYTSLWRKCPKQGFPYTVQGYLPVVLSSIAIPTTVCSTECEEYASIRSGSRCNNQPQLTRQMAMPLLV